MALAADQVSMTRKQWFELVLVIFNGARVAAYKDGNSAAQGNPDGSLGWTTAKLRKPGTFTRMQTSGNTIAALLSMIHRKAMHECETKPFNARIARLTPL